MLNDIKPPPLEPRDSRGNGVAPLGHGGAQPHDEKMALGKHHARYMGEPARTDPIYEMPFEERGSGFNVAMSVITLILFGVLILLAWWTLR